MTSSVRPGPPCPTRPAGRLVSVLVLLVGVAIGLLLTTSRADAQPAPRDGTWPLRPRPPVVTPFHPPQTRFGPGHRGVDLAGPVGAPVHTALAGRVGFAGRLAGRGVVVVDHGATRTTYEPVAAGVHVGDRLAAGAVIGRLQLFGSHCFPRACLHWGLIEGRDHYLDPLTLVGAAPVRLLPLTSRRAPSPGESARWPPSTSMPGTGVPPLGCAQARGWACR